MKKIILGFLVLSMFLISGCVQIDVYQKIKRNGNIDLSLTLKSESSMILNAMKQNLEVDPSVMEKYTYEEGTDSVTYKFTDINPLKDNIFKQKEDSKTDTSMFNKDNFKFKKEFSFPYYYYTYGINMGNGKSSSSKEENPFGEMFKIGYTIEVFGTVVDTNGNKMADNKVKFNINPDEDKAYYVKFKDFFLASWFGSMF